MKKWQNIYLINSLAIRNSNKNIIRLTWIINVYLKNKSDLFLYLTQINLQISSVKMSHVVNLQFLVNLSTKILKNSINGNFNNSVHGYKYQHMYLSNLLKNALIKNNHLMIFKKMCVHYQWLCNTYVVQVLEIVKKKPSCDVLHQYGGSKIDPLQVTSSIWGNASCHF